MCRISTQIDSIRKCLNLLCNFFFFTYLFAAHQKTETNNSIRMPEALNDGAMKMFPT